jgi:hypothetical protein
MIPALLLMWLSPGATRAWSPALDPGEGRILVAPLSRAQAC